MSISKESLPDKFKQYIYEDEEIYYASNPSRGALTLSMIVHGITWGILGLALYFVGIFITLPLALLFTHLAWKHRYYIITDKRTIVSQGIFNVAVKIIPNQSIQMLSINTGIIDRWLKLNTLEISTAAQGGGNIIFAFFPGMSKGSVQLKWIDNVSTVLKHYGFIFK